MVHTTVPQHVPGRLVRDFNHVTGKDVVSDAFKPFRDAAGERIFYSPHHGGYWVLTRAADIREALQKPDVFSSRISGIPAQPPRPEKLRPLELDPPDHALYRRVLAPMFAPKVVAAKSAAIRATCVTLLDGFADRGHCELIEDFAEPFPATVFTEMLGLPSSEAAKFVEWDNILLHAYDDPARRQQAGIEINAYLRDVVADRAEHPRDDMLSALLSSSIGDRPITRKEVHDFAYLLFIAGLDTVTAALSFVFRFLAENDGHRKQLVESPDLIADAVEELLRVHAFVNMSRTVEYDTEFCGVQMKQGDRLLASTTFAARDGEEFTDPLEVRFDRQANRHIAFGAGPHRCAGSHLAREELRIAVEEFHRRIPDYRVVDGAEIRMHGGGAMGMDRLPLTWATQPGRDR